MRAVFNFVRPTIEAQERSAAPGASLARNLASSPASLAHRPILELVRSAIAGSCRSRHVAVPLDLPAREQRAFVEAVEARGKDRQHYVTDVGVDFSRSAREAYTSFRPENGKLRLNGYHPFVATFYDEFNNPRRRQPLELLAMAEVLAEAHLYSIGVASGQIEDFLSARDQLLRYLTDATGRQSALSIANRLLDARNSPDALEEAVNAAFGSLGFDVTPLGKSGRPDGVASAHAAAEQPGQARGYKVSLEAKSKVIAGAKVSAKAVGIAEVVRHRDAFECDHAVVVGPGFPTSRGDQSALGDGIAKDRANTLAAGQRRTITLITVDALAQLVRIRPLKRIGLVKIRELFECRLPEESAAWVAECAKGEVEAPPYREIIETIEALQKRFPKEPVKYSALRVQLAALPDPVDYETDHELMELCRGMAQMAPEAMFARDGSVELDQSAENVIAAIDSAMHEYPLAEIG